VAWVPATEFRPIQRLVDHVVSPRRFFVLLVGVFAALGLILASLGIYGVISYSVTQRTQEIGIRMALGASQGRVQMAVLERTLLLALIGIRDSCVLDPFVFCLHVAGRGYPCPHRRFQHGRLRIQVQSWPFDGFVTKLSDN